ncbi:MAG TPA: hypothetical protein VLP43_07070 [Solirubrobacteraceae bacterium]|nr:hypothetical protein [Solirubrobacteraceae bacterium]
MITVALTRILTSPSAARLRLQRDPTSELWEQSGRGKDAGIARTPELVQRKELGVEPRPDEEFGGGTLFLADARTAFLLINHARRQAISRLVGVTGDNANIVTLIGIMILAQAARDRGRRLVAPGGPPTAADGLLGAAVFRELLADAAGAAARETPLTSTLLLVAVASSSLARRAILRSATGAIRSASHRVGAGFHHRYGYLFDPAHLRKRRAQRHTEEPAMAIRR